MSQIWEYMDQRLGYKYKQIRKGPNKAGRGIRIENSLEKVSRIKPDFRFDDLIDIQDENDTSVFSLAKDAASKGTAAKRGLQTNSLQCVR